MKQIQNETNTKRKQVNDDNNIISEQNFQTKRQQVPNETKTKRKQ